MTDLRKIDIPGVSPRKIFSVLTAALAGEGMTRYELAQAAHISNVTVGKIVSAMTELDLLRTEAQYASQKRSPEKIFPSDRIVTLVFTMSKRKLSAAICDLSGRTLFTHSRAVNESLPPESDLSAFANSISETIRPIIDNKICNVAIILSALSPNLLRYMTSPILANAEMLDANDCISAFINKQYPSERVVYMSAEHELNVSLFNSGAAVSPTQTTGIVDWAEGEASAIEFISEYLSPVFRIFSPHRIIVSSETLGVNARFASELRAAIKRHSHIDEEKMPDVTLRGELDFATLSAVGHIREKIAKIISGVEEQ